VIHDISPNTGPEGTFVSDSLKIIDYLNTAYPESVPLVDTDGVLAKLVSSGVLAATSQLWRLTAPRLAQSIKGEESKQVYGGNVEKKLGRSIDALLTDREVHDEAWKAGLEMYRAVKKYFDECRGARGLGEDGGPWLLGKEPQLVDVFTGGSLMWFKNIMGEDSEEWQEVTELDGGFWGKYAKTIEAYAAI